MRNWMCPALFLTLFAAQQASACPYSEVVEAWYHDYLCRPADRAGLINWVKRLRCRPQCEVECEFLSSAEYYKRGGCTPHGFIARVYEDVLFRKPCERDIKYWCRKLSKCRNNRMLFLSRHFMPTAEREFAKRARGYRPRIPRVYDDPTHEPLHEHRHESTRPRFEPLPIRSAFPPSRYRREHVEPSRYELPRLRRGYEYERYPY